MRGTQGKRKKEKIKQFLSVGDRSPYSVPQGLESTVDTLSCRYIGIIKGE